MITKDRFQQLWKALVEDRTVVNKADDDSANCPLVSSNGVSDKLKEVLIENSSDKGSCLASKIPGELNW